MSNPDWYRDLASKLEEHLLETDEKFVKGEQFLRNYLDENVPQDMNDEDEFVELHLDLLQKYLITLEFFYIDSDSYVWKKAEEKSKEYTAPSDTVNLGKKNADVQYLDALKEKTNSLSQEEIECVKQILLDESFSYDDIELLRYQLAKNIERLDVYNDSDTSEAWISAAKVSRSSLKKVECFESAAKYKAKEYKFDDAAKYILDAILEIEPRFQRDDINFIKKASNRISIYFDTKNYSTEELMRLTRKYRILAEQAGLRKDASRAFVFEQDINVMGKAWYKRIVPFIYWLSSKYGESPIRVLICSLLIILFWACLYGLVGIQYNLSEGQPGLDNYLTNVYFSIVTFTTLGYGDFSPVENGRIFASLQAMLGLFMTSLFLVTFVRRYSR